MTIQALAVIPARFGSTRFPGKPLAAETGKPLIQHVVEQADKAACLTRIVVATDDQRIFDAVKAFGADVVMTSADHPNGTSRIAETLDKLEAAGDVLPECIVNVQGDEPDIEPRVIDELVAGLMADDDAPMATLASDFAADEDPSNPNIVKVAVDQLGRAMYFSRSLLPFPREAAAGAQPLKHPGLYAYRRSFLPTYLSLSPTPLEQAEQLEQLRVLEHGHRIAIVRTQVRHHGIDTPQQYAAFVKRWLEEHGSAPA